MNKYNIFQACTGKFSPIHQWFYFDALECLPVDGVSEEDAQPVCSEIMHNFCLIFK